LFLLSAVLLLQGSVWVSPGKILLDVLGLDGLEGVEEVIFYSRRVPVLAGALASSVLLAVSGMLYQVLFRNPMADPYVLGVASSSFVSIVVLAYLVYYVAPVRGGLFAVGTTLAPLASTLGAMVYTLVLSLLAVRTSNLQLLLVGISVGFVFTGVSMLLLSLLPADVAGYLQLSLLGSVERVSKTQATYLLLGALVAASVSAYLSVKHLDPLMLGEDYAVTLGVNVRLVRSVASLVAGLSTAITVAFVGVVGFIGFAAPHVARLVSKSGRSSVTLAYSVVIAPIMVLSCVSAARALFPGSSVPLTALTSLFGAPMLVYLVYRIRGEYSW
jgi:iron complex transport system permease protein